MTDPNYTKYLDDEDANHTRRYYQAGMCPCCGSDLTSWPSPSGEYIEPQAIAEGVMLCGRCIGNEHQETPGFVEWILQSIANVRGKKSWPQ